MLELRPTCEHCNRALPPESKEAMICTFECTWCIDCNEAFLHGLFPNCEGDLQMRPIRPQSHLKKYPPSKTIVHKPVDLESFIPKRDQLKNVDV